MFNPFMPFVGVMFLVFNESFLECRGASKMLSTIWTNHDMALFDLNKAV